MTILAHVLCSSNSQVEPAATQALLYILRSSKRLSKAFLEICGDVGINIELGRIEAENALDEASDGRPDITVYDGSGTRRLLVENKFWAGLTKAQPVDYLKSLPDKQSALLFIVPSERVGNVWHELKKRCDEERLVLGQESKQGSVWWIRVNRQFLMIASWDFILSLLQRAAQAIGLHNIDQDIIQLKGLVKEITDTAFLPLRSEEPGDQAIPKRLMNYFQLVQSVISELQTNDFIGKASNGTNDHQMGRYFYVRDELQLWLGVAMDVWRKRAATPLWCWVNRSSLGDVVKAKSKIESKLSLGPDYIYENADAIYIPVQLKWGVEKEYVVQHAASTVREIANILVDHDSV